MARANNYVVDFAVKACFVKIYIFEKYGIYLSCLHELIQFLHLIVDF